ncbi:hypothetical protein POSPLADRAFT_1138960, partial [Postia placenta MAD-698-R-SB12]
AHENVLDLSERPRSLFETLPINDLGPELSSRLEASLKVSEGVDCAKSARLWESLLEVYRIPYLLLRVADMRMTLKSRPTALTLYEELTSITVEEYKIGIPAFAASQRWQSTIETPFPHCKLQQMQIKELRDEWSSMGDPHILMDKFLNMHALATNKIEGNVDLNYSDTTRLIQVGFYHQMEPTSLKHIITSTAMDRAEILSILRDTHETLRDVFELLKSEHIHLTVNGICKLHETLMQTNRVRYFPEAPVGLKYIYLNIGVTRQVSRLNVTAPLNATAAFGEKGTAVQEFPVEKLGQDVALQLEASLKVEPSDGVACAASARLWEALLENYRVPYLLLRVADMRFALGSQVTALSLYEEYWRSTVTANAPFPCGNLKETEFRRMYEMWGLVSKKANDADKFFNFHCIETTVIEGVVMFDAETRDDLIMYGLDEKAVPVEDSSIVAGAVRGCADARAILRDTRQAIDEIYTLAKCEPIMLTVETICRLHQVLMKTSRVLHFKDNNSDGPRLAYTNIGVTRQHSRVNVVVQNPIVMIQFCPFDQVDKELRVFCERFNDLVRQDDVDPFAAAAWISDVFVTIHPFEDGNGRLSRLLASVPLIRKDLPLLRADRDGDYRQLMHFLYLVTVISVTTIKMMIGANNASNKICQWPIVIRFSTSSAKRMHYQVWEGHLVRAAQTEADTHSAKKMIDVPIIACMHASILNFKRNIRYSIRPSTSPSKIFCMDVNGDDGKRGNFIPSTAGRRARAEQILPAQEARRNEQFNKPISKQAHISSYRYIYMSTMTSWQQHDTQYRSMDNGTRPCKYFGSFGEVDGKDVESEEDIGWIADVCDDLAENMDSGTVATLKLLMLFRAQPYYLTENIHHPMTREDLIASEDGLVYNTSIFTSCADTDSVSTALAPGLHMADQNATTNEYDAHTDGEEDLFNEQDREAGTTVSACPPAPRHTTNGMADKEMSSIKDDRTGEGYVDVRTNVWPPARSPQPAQISDASGARDASVLCATTTQDHHSHSRQGLKHKRMLEQRCERCGARLSTGVAMPVRDNRVRGLRPPVTRAPELASSFLTARVSAFQQRNDDADEDNDEMAHVKTTTSAEPTQERKVKKIRIEPTEVPHVTCPGCGGSFREDTFGRHWRDHCGMSPERENRQPLICDVCRRMWQPGNDRLRDFSTDHSLRRHVVRRHTEEDWHAMQRERGKKTRRSHKRSKGAAELPVDTLGKDVALQLEASLKVESSNGVACAASARLWEALLEDHGQVTAHNLYEERRNPGKLDSSDSAFSIIGYSGTAMWKTVSKKASNADRFFNLHCIETTVIEGVVMFDESTRYDLIMDGLDEKAVPVDDSSIVAGTVRSCTDARAILRDTRQETRQHARVNVVVQNPIVMIQFCPFDQVDKELRVFCERFNDLVRQDDVDPFAAAAWISDVFVTIHPFEASNALLPLLDTSLTRLFGCLRANRDGDYSRLMRFLYLVTDVSLTLIKMMIDIAQNDSDGGLDPSPGSSQHSVDTILSREDTSNIFCARGPGSQSTRQNASNKEYTTETEGGSHVHREQDGNTANALIMPPMCRGQRSFGPAPIATSTWEPAWEQIRPRRYNAQPSARSRPPSELLYSREPEKPWA